MLHDRGPDLAKYLRDGFGLRRVLAVEPGEVAETWDIEVEGAHNFVADGLVVHNSGLVGAVYGKMRGDPAAGHGRRYFTTGSISTGVPGLKAGFGGLLNIGVTSGTGHMAGNYGGLGFEARSTRTGIFTGRAARSPASFARHFHMAQGGAVEWAELLARLPGLDVAGDAGRMNVIAGRFRGYDAGGWLPPHSTTLAVNRTSQWEPVGPPGAARTINVTVPLTIYGEITASQRAQMHAIAEDMGERVAAELSDALARRGSGV
jgi:hypothetical protein